jgi:hypothetical protein
MTNYSANYTVPDAWGRVSRLTKTYRNRRFHYDSDATGILCGSRNMRDWVTRRESTVNCPRCLKLLAALPRPEIP